MYHETSRVVVFYFYFYFPSVYVRRVVDCGVYKRMSADSENPSDKSEMGIMGYGLLQSRVACRVSVPPRAALFYVASGPTSVSS